MVYGNVHKGRLPENVAGFVRLLRRAGLPVDVARASLATQALSLIDIGEREQVRAALQAVLVNRHQDIEVFEELFEAYFRDPKIAQQLLAQLLPNTPGASEREPRSPRAQEALFVGAQARHAENQKEQKFQLDAAMTATERHRLQHADFETLNASEYQLVMRLAQQIRVRWPRITMRRHRSSVRGTRADWAEMVRAASRHDLEFVDMAWLQPRSEPVPLLILVDISGSMERYARLMLAFLHQATRNLRTRVFALGTQLTDLSSLFRLNDTDAMLEGVNHRVQDFAGGTRLGACLHTLETQHRSAVVGQRSLVLLISDGLETGETTQLEEGARWLSRQARFTLWLNPLLRYHDYAPLARGSAILERYFDRSLAIHNLENLQQLAGHLQHILSNPRRNRTHLREASA